VLKEVFLGKSEVAKGSSRAGTAVDPST